MDYVYAFYICKKTIQCTMITYWVISRIQNSLCCKQGSSFVIVCICILFVCFNQMLPTSDGNIITKQNASVYLVCHWSFFMIILYFTWFVSKYKNSSFVYITFCIFNITWLLALTFWSAIQNLQVNHSIQKKNI